jgi:hypothetical protein
VYPGSNLEAHANAKGPFALLCRVHALAATDTTSSVSLITVGCASLRGAK